MARSGVLLSLGLGAVALTGLFVLAQPGGGGRGPGGFPGGETRKVLKDHDKNKDGWLNLEERKVAREAIKKDRPGGGFGPGGGRGPGGFGPGGFGPGGGGAAPKPGIAVSPKDVPVFGKESLYEPTVLRTLFLTFENKDWEAELEDFHGTDVDVPASLLVDGRTYQNVGVRFRGMSSYMMVRAGSKRSLNLALDLADSKQRLGGYKTLNLLNAHDDPSMLNSVIYSHIARHYIPAPKANLVRVVINGENWGIYNNVQQFNKEFLSENFQSTKGARWKVSGSPNAAGGLEYLGDTVEQYKRRFEIKTPDDEKSWKALVNLCKVLNQTPPEKLEAALKPIVDVDSLLWFLALDVALVNLDGYWIRSSDYSIYLDDKGKFHFIPHDMNEAFRVSGGGPWGPGGPGGGRGPGGGMMFPPKPGEILPPPVIDQLKLTDQQKKDLAVMQKDLDDKLAKLLTEVQRKQLKELGASGPGGGFGPGGFGPGGPGGGPGGGGFGPPGMGGGGVELDPLVGLTDTRKPLRSKLLAVPSLRAKYLQNIKTIAERSLDWKTLGPVVAQYRKLIEKEVELDTKKLGTLEAFQRATADELPIGQGNSFRAFADLRRKYLLNWKEPAK